MASNDLWLEIVRQRRRLLVAARREVHVNAPAEDALIAGFDFGVADEVKGAG